MDYELINIFLSVSTLVAVSVNTCINLIYRLRDRK